MTRHSAIALVVSALALPGSAAGELPEPFGTPPMVDDYRVGYGLETGIWPDGQVTLQHRVSLQLPLWAASVGAMLPFANAMGAVNDSVVGNLRLSGQWFRRFSIAPRTAVVVGGGLDGYAPTATPVRAQDSLSPLLAGAVAGEAALHAPDLSIALRPRVQAGGELWIFSLQVTAAAAVHFVGSQARVAIEWSATLAGSLTPWLALVFEGNGVSWVVEPPEWMAERIVSLGGGLRFRLPAGFRPALWVRGPLPDGPTERGVGTYLGLEVQWQHDRAWFLF